MTWRLHHRFIIDTVDFNTVQKLIFYICIFDILIDVEIVTLKIIAEIELWQFGELDLDDQYTMANISLQNAFETLNSRQLNGR